MYSPVRRSVVERKRTLPFFCNGPPRSLDIAPAFRLSSQKACPTQRSAVVASDLFCAYGDRHIRQPSQRQHTAGSSSPSSSQFPQNHDVNREGCHFPSAISFYKLIPHIFFQPDQCLHLAGIPCNVIAAAYVQSRIGRTYQAHECDFQTASKPMNSPTTPLPITQIRLLLRSRHAR